MLRRSIQTALVLAVVAGCTPASEPDHLLILDLYGDPYERGHQHGEAVADRIRSLYTRLLETALIPYLNREQPDVASFLPEYQKEQYSDGRFSYELLLQSGQHLVEELEQTRPEYVQELHGIADGAQVPFEQILILNTFMDTMLAFRSITFFIKQFQAPYIVELEFQGGLGEDGVDNNCDGAVDDPHDSEVANWTERRGWKRGYGPSPWASMVEVPPDATVRFLLFDPPPFASFFQDEDELTKKGEAQGVDPDSIRIQVGDKVFQAGQTDAIETEVIQDRATGEDAYLEVLFAPPGGFPEGQVVSMVIHAANVSRLETPPPLHARIMRDERIVFTTRGAGAGCREVQNRGMPDGRTQPPSIAFAVRGAATPDREPRLAQHFALLDANVSHEHGVLLRHHPESGGDFVVPTWTGLVGGMSGMNGHGLAYAVTMSDTLDNSLTAAVKEDFTTAKLLCEGVPLLIMGRELLEHASSAREAAAMLRDMPSTFGWEFLLQDGSGDMAVVELDSDIGQDRDPVVFGPEDPLPEGAWVATPGSVRGDDLRIASHFQRNLPDMDTVIILFPARPQRYWSSFFYRSIRTHYVLGELLDERYGSLDLPGVIDLLRVPDLVDTRDSMVAAVYEPGSLTLHLAMGTVPATDGVFRTFGISAEGEVEP